MGISFFFNFYNKFLHGYSHANYKLKLTQLLVLTKPTGINVTIKLDIKQEINDRKKALVPVCISFDLNFICAKIAACC